MSIVIHTCYQSPESGPSVPTVLISAYFSIVRNLFMAFAVVGLGMHKTMFVHWNAFKNVIIFGSKKCAVQRFRCFVIILIIFWLHLHTENTWTIHVP